jgi:hypothetical protein
MNSYLRYAFSDYWKEVDLFDIWCLFIGELLYNYKIIKILRSHITMQVIKMAKKQF